MRKFNVNINRYVLKLIDYMNKLYIFIYSKDF